MQPLNDIEQEAFDLGIIVEQLQWHDVYTWQVTYRDGTSTNEYDEVRPDGRGWHEREDKPVQTVALLWTGETTEVASIALPDNSTPVFFRRRTLTVNPNTNERTQDPTVHCIGWKRGDKACYLFVFSDGSTLMTDNLQAV